MTSAERRYLPLSGIKGLYRRMRKEDQMGNEASTGLASSGGQKSRRLSHDPTMDARRRSKKSLREQHAQESTESHFSSDSGYGHPMVFQKNTRSASQSRRFQRQRSRDSDEMMATIVTTTSGTSSLGSQYGDFLSIPQQLEGGLPVSKGQMPRKGSYQGTARELIVAAALGADRRRSKSLCNQQIKASENPPSFKGCATTSNGSANTSRRSSNGLLPSITRLRIQQCYKAAKPTIGQQIIKRACSLRSEMRAFIAHLPEETVDQMGKDIFQLITQSVGSIDDPERVGSGFQKGRGILKSLQVTVLSQHYGEKQAELCAVGFRPEFFSAIADASIAECVRLDNGAHKRCETLLAWSHLMESMFSSTRDGYYAKIRYQRRLSLPQHRLNLVKPSSFEIRTASLDSAC